MSVLAVIIVVIFCGLVAVVGLVYLAHRREWRSRNPDEGVLEGGAAATDADGQVAEFKT